MTDLITLIDNFKYDMECSFWPNKRDLALCYQSLYPEIKGLYELLLHVDLT